jgi:hypothetical protein
VGGGVGLHKMRCTLWLPMRTVTCVPAEQGSYGSAACPPRPPCLSAFCTLLLCSHYCQDEPDLEAAVELLSQDDGAGWQLLQHLVCGTASAAELAASPFCQLR